MKNQFTLLALLFFGTLFTQAQTERPGEISGIVKDSTSGAGLQGANILIKGTKKGTTTDASGYFKIPVTDPNAILVISSVGYANREVNIEGKNEIAVTLASLNRELEQVVVVGYGSQRK